jgi:hypothetical protein
MADWASVLTTANPTLDRRPLTDGDHSGDKTTTDVFLEILRIHWYH